MLEMTVVCSALKHFQEHIFGKRVVTYTDHRPLLRTSTIQNKTINRLVENMNICNIDLWYGNGAENQGANFLSRNVVLEISQQDRFGEIRNHQHQGTLTVVIIRGLEHNIQPTDEELRKAVLYYGPRCFMKDSILCFVPARSNISRSVLFTPISKVPNITKNAHGTALSDHWSKLFTISNVSMSYFWPTLAKDLANFINFVNREKELRYLQKGKAHPKASYE
jgi:hypothetical protein